MSNTPIVEGNNNLADEVIEAPDSSSYQKLKESHTNLEKKLQAQENASQAEKRKQEDRIKALEASIESIPKEDSERIANLEVALARSTAVSRYGLSEDDAALLKGSPNEIIEDAKYWAERLKATNTNKNDDTSNKDMIDQKINNQVDNTQTPSPNPTPKKKGLSWLETYNQANPNERYKMEQDVFKGVVDPHK